jgi:hypothetical protein
MSSGTTNGATVCVRVIILACLYGFFFRSKPTEVYRIRDFQLLGMLTGMNFVMKSGVQRPVLVNNVMISHLSPFS